MKRDHQENGKNCIIPNRGGMRIASSSSLSSWMALMQRQYLKQFCSFLMLNRQQHGGLLPLPCHIKMVADKTLATVSLSSPSSHFEWASHLLKNTSRFDPTGHLHCPRSLSYARKRRRTTSTSLQSSSRRRRTAATTTAASIIRQMRASTHQSKEAEEADDDDEGSAKVDMWKGLQTLIPGGNGMEPPKLLKEMAHYVLFLQMQSRSLHHLLTTLSA